MANLRIIGENYSDVAVLTADPVLPSTTPVDNLKSVSRSKVIRTNAFSEPDSTQDILGNILPVKDISAIVLGRHNFPTGTDITIILYTGLDQTGTPTSSGVLTITAEEAGSDIIAWGSFIWGGISWGQDNLSEEFEPKANFVYWITTPVSNIQSFKISIVVPSQEVEIGRLIIGEYIEPIYNISYGHKLSWTENTTQFRTDGGTLRSDISIPTRKLEFDIGTIDEPGRAILQDSLRLVGLRKDLFISLFPEETVLTKKIDYSGIMKLTRVPSMTEYALNYYKSKYIMEEV